MNNVSILINTLKSGGAERQSILLHNSLCEKYHLLLIVYHGDCIDERMRHLISENNSSLIFLKGSYISKFVKIVRLLRKNKIEVVFTYLTKPSFFGSLAARFANVKHVYTSIRSSKLPYWKFVIELFSNRIASGTIINSCNGAQLFKMKGIRNVHVIQNCIECINPIKYRPDRELISIITVGRFVPEKDYHTACKAICVLVESGVHIKYTIVGYGAMESKIREFLKSMKIFANVELIINPDNIPDLLDNADIYLSTSLFEGTSNSIMEAMNASLPIVATRVGDNDILVEEGRNGFLHDVGDYNSIAKSLETLIRDYNLRNVMGVESKKILSENYSFEKFKKAYIDLIEAK